MRLLARQLGRPDMTLERLCAELGADAPAAGDGETLQRQRVQHVYEFCYRQLSDRGRRLFERLSRLPGGLWCSQFADYWLIWRELLDNDWRLVLKKELEPFDLVYYEPKTLQGTGECFILTPALLGFARTQYRADPEWEARWIKFWLRRLRYWKDRSGRRPRSDPPTTLSCSGLEKLDRPGLTQLFDRTQANWRLVFVTLVEHQDGARLRELLRGVAAFLRQSRRLALFQDLLEDVVSVLRLAEMKEALVSCLALQGRLLEDLARLPAARQAYEEAVTHYQHLAESRPAVYVPKLAGTLDQLGQILRMLGDLPPARRCFEEALRRYRDLARSDPDGCMPMVAATLGRLGDLFYAGGELEAAVRAYTEALEHYRRLGRQATVFDAEIAGTALHLGKTWYTLGDKYAARRCCEEALRGFRRLAQTRPHAFEPNVATTLDNLGMVLRDLGELKQARRAFEGALEIFHRIAEQHPDRFAAKTARTLNRLGLVLHRLHDPGGAQLAYQEALVLYRQLAAADPAENELLLAAMLARMGGVLGDAGDRVAARTVYDEALQLYAARYPQDPAAIGPAFKRALRHYTRITGDITNEDPWWEWWCQLQQPLPETRDAAAK